MYLTTTMVQDNDTYNSRFFARKGYLCWQTHCSFAPSFLPYMARLNFKKFGNILSNYVGMFDTSLITTSLFLLPPSRYLRQSALQVICTASRHRQCGWLLLNRCRIREVHGDNSMAQRYLKWPRKISDYLFSQHKGHLCRLPG